MAARSSLPRRLEKAVFQQFGSQCAFCQEKAIPALQVHHIEPYAEVKEHEIENLILVCANCHGRIEAGEIPKAAVYRRKLQAVSVRPPPSKSSGNSIRLESSENSGVIANQLTIKIGNRKGVSVSAPSGTIASHRDSRNYVKYLIDRYHEFKRSEVGSESIKYPIFYAAIKREFGAKWDHIPLERFEELVTFIQARIDKTVVGKNQKAKGLARYRSFRAYIEKYGLR